MFWITNLFVYICQFGLMITTFWNSLSIVFLRDSSDFMNSMLLIILYRVNISRVYYTNFHYLSLVHISLELVIPSIHCPTIQHLMLSLYFQTLLLFRNYSDTSLLIYTIRHYKKCLIMFNYYCFMPFGYFSVSFFFF